MAIGRRFRSDFGADDTACAGTCIHDDLLAPRFSELLPDQPPDDVRTRGGRAQCDDAYRLGWILLRACIRYRGCTPTDKTHGREHHDNPQWNSGPAHELSRMKVSSAAEKEGQ